MNFYALWQTCKHKNKTITISQDPLPIWATEDIVTVEVSHNPFFGYDEVNCWVFSSRTLDVKKLYSLFMQLKKQAMTETKSAGKGVKLSTALPSDF